MLPCALLASCCWRRRLDCESAGGGGVSGADSACWFAFVACLALVVVFWFGFGFVVTSARFDKDFGSRLPFDCGFEVAFIVCGVRLVWWRLIDVLVDWFGCGLKLALFLLTELCANSNFNSYSNSNLVVFGNCNSKRLCVGKALKPVDTQMQQSKIVKRAPVTYCTAQPLPHLQLQLHFFVLFLFSISISISLVLIWLC